VDRPMDLASRWSGASVSAVPPSGGAAGGAGGGGSAGLGAGAGPGGTGGRGGLNLGAGATVASGSGSGSGSGKQYVILKLEEMAVVSEYACPVFSGIEHHSSPLYLPPRSALQSPSTLASTKSRTPAISRTLKSTATVVLPLIQTPIPIVDCGQSC
jgi:hypothetical protein